MAFRPYSSWRPDACGLNTLDAGEALGVLPSPRGYGPWPSLAATSQALAATCRGAFTARKSNGSYVVFAGTATKLYKFDTVGNPWIDVTRGSGGDYSTPSDGFWSFAQFDNLLIACNGVDAVQVIDVDDISSPAFDALGGSPPVAKYVRVVGDHVMLYDLASAQGSVASSGHIQFAWSGLRDPDYWTFGEKSSSFGTLFSGGFIMGGTSLLGGLIFQQNAINRLVRDPYKIFDATPILEAQGTESPYSITPHEGTTYFYGTDGFMEISAGGGIRQIGNDWVDNWFLEECDGSRVNEIVGAMDPIRMRWFVAFPTSSSGANFDHILCFDTLNAERPWTHAPFDVDYIFGSASVGLNLSEITALYPTLEDMPYPFGSRVFLGGAPGLAAIDSAHKWAFFVGSPTAAAVQTTRFQPIPGRRCFVNGYRPIDDAAAGSGRVAVAERPQDAIDANWSAGSDLNSVGVIPLRASGRYVKFERSIPAGTEWGDSEMKGIEFDDGMIVDDGER
jgi:hypothetical protein